MQGGRWGHTESSCTYCDLGLDDYAEESENKHVRAPFPCAHERFVPTRCMLERAERLTSEQVDPWSCMRVPLGVAGGDSTSPPGATG